MHRDRSLTWKEAIAHCKACRTIVDPSISQFLVSLLQALERLHRGSNAEVMAQPENSSNLDLNAEGRKVIAEQSTSNDDLSNFVEIGI
jgi:hypothetical protein